MFLVLSFFIIINGGRVRCIKKCTYHLLSSLFLRTKLTEEWWLVGQLGQLRPCPHVIQQNRKCRTNLRL